MGASLRADCRSRAALARDRAEQVLPRLRSCDLCPRRCHLDRLTGHGSCHIGRHAVVASYGPHFGEEPPLVGSHGSGTIFFAGCNLHCCFCQNSRISQSSAGREVSPEALAAIMLELQEEGCHNLNLVTPTHLTWPILAALAVAYEAGLAIPLVYNCGGWECVTTLRLFDGLVDIYMPDCKYGAEGPDRLYSAAPGYPAVNRAALREMHRQVGDLRLDDRGLAARGLIIRHLVLPDDLADSPAVARFLADEISRDCYVNVMGQYRPVYRAPEHEALNRCPTPAELATARAAFESAGIHRFAR